MTTLPLTEFEKVPYLDKAVIQNRALVPILPFWDGERWHHWISGDRKLHLLHPTDATDTDYVGKSAQREEDLRIPFVEFMWQRGQLCYVGRHFKAICDDFHNLFASVAKLKMLHRLWSKDSRPFPQSFVSTEVEYMLTVARGVFDLLYETIRTIWESTTLNSTGMPPKKKLPDKFSKFILKGADRKPRNVDELIQDYDVPPAYAAAVSRSADFFTKIRGLRDAIVHGLGSPPAFYRLEKGFAVSRFERPFDDFPWKENHSLNETVVSLLPWLSHLVLGTIEACNDITFAFASEVVFPPEIAPGFMVFVRCETSHIVLDLLAAHRNDLVWWEPE